MYKKNGYKTFFKDSQKAFQRLYQYYCSKKSFNFYQSKPPINDYIQF